MNLFAFRNIFWYIMLIRLRGMGSVGTPPVVTMAFLVCIRFVVSVRMFINICRSCIFVIEFISPIIEGSWWLVVVTVFIALI